MAGEAAKQCLVVWWQFLLVLWKNFILQVSLHAACTSRFAGVSITTSAVARVSLQFFLRVLLICACVRLLQIRRPIGTVFELLIPPLAVIVLIGLRLAKMSRPRNSPACSSLKLKLISAPYILMSACNGQVFISVMQQK
jgi:hypothetical protein